MKRLQLRHHSTLLLCTTCLIAIAPPGAWAGTQTWSGPAGGDWTNAANWGGAVPGSGDTANINSVGPNVATAVGSVNVLSVGDTGTGTLAISSGGSVSSNTGYVGRNSGSTGTVAIDGAGSSWVVGGALYAGASGNGTLNLSNGATAQSGTTTIGQNSSSVGTLSIQSGATLTNASHGYLGGNGGSGSAIISGSGSQWSSGGNLYVGNTVNSTGTLIVEDGGTVSSVDGYVGASSGSTGTATVTGAGSIWANSGSLYVASSGTGTLTVSDGGAVSNVNAYVGNLLGSTGTVAVTGPGATFTSTSSLRIGVYGNGTVDVSAGGSVSTAITHIARQTSGVGLVAVHGPGSTWTSNTEINVGHSGNGTLNVSDGGSVGASSGYIGRNAGSTGTAMVSGAGSTWSNTGNLYVGTDGDGTLTISDGGAVSDAAGYVGRNADSVGSATVTGAGSTWTSGAGLYVGSYGDGTLAIADGGSAASATGSIGQYAGATGSVTVTGLGSHWLNNGDLDVGLSGEGALSVVAGGMVGNAAGHIGHNVGSTGTATVNGVGSQWTSSGNLYVGTDGDGTLMVSAGGAVSDAAGYLARNAGSTGSATVSGAGSTWTSSAGLYVGSYGDGTLSVTNGGSVVSAAGSIGQYAGADGTATVMGSGSTWTASGTLAIGESGDGILNVFAEGHVSSADGVIGRNAGSTGVARVNRTGSNWSNSGDLVVGQDGDGELHVEEGATVDVGQVLSIGRNTGATGALALESTGEVHSARGEIGYAGGTGSAVVTGDGSVWAIDTDLYLAASENPGDPAGSATVTLSDRGEIRLPGTVYLAGAALSQATLNIGAAAGDAAAAAGTLVADHVAFGDGDGAIVFNHTSSAYAFAPDITGSGTITVLAGNTLLAGDLSGFSGTASVSEGANLTTASAQDASLANLSESAASAMIESRAVGQQLLGANRPVTGQNYGFAEALYGSAQGMIGGQYTVDDFALFGGAAYGTQDYDGVEQDGATTLALGGRYMLGDGAVRPFAELGGWVTPNGNLSLQRTYVINALPGGPAGETATGTGVTRAQSWAGYGRAGVVLTVADRHQLVGYGEIGRQSLAYDGYVESSGPFRATVDDGNLSFNVARLGGSYTHDLGELLPIRSAITLSGAAAQSFGAEGGIDAEVAGVGMSSDAADDASWGEFGARLHLRASDDVALSLGLTGTTQWDGMDTAVHGFVGVSYRF